jgi:predicted O-methyltransferase YrrM
MNADRTYNEQGWQVRSAAGTEVEVQQMLYGLVLATKPTLVVETGCYDGFTTAVLAEAQLKAGRGGRVVTCDTDPLCIQQTEKRIAIAAAALPRLRDIVTTVRCRGVDLPELREADLVFSDSNYANRIDEMLAVKPGALIVVHDTRISFDGAIPPLSSWVEERGGLLFDTYRGFGMLRVPVGGLRA